MFTKPSLCLNNDQLMDNQLYTLAASSAMDQALDLLPFL
jgi:hypothetical protein